MSALPDGGRALAALRRQRRIVHELDALSARQRRLVHEGAPDAILGLLALRQTLVDEFVGMQASLADASDRMTRQELPAGERDEIRSLIGEIEAGLARVLAADADDQRHLERRRDETRDELATVGHARRVRAAYRPTGGPSPRFTDRQG